MTENVVGKKMVAGFLFGGQRVLLVCKTRPAWQAGLWNGVGGLIESSETPLAAMMREFQEETGCTMELDWRHFCTEIEPFGAYVYFFCARLQESDENVVWPSTNDVGENLGIWNVKDIERLRCLGNLRWLVPLAQDWRSLEPVVVTARGDIRERASW